MPKKYNRRTKRRNKRSRRKNKRSRRRKNKRSRRKRQRGGCGSSSCSGTMNKNMGQHYTLRPYNNLAGPALDWLTPKGTNQNLSYKSLKGGKRRRRRKSRMKGGRRSRNQRGGASVLQALGLGDVLTAYHSLGNSLSNIGNSWSGRPHTESARVTSQPHLAKDIKSDYITPDIERHAASGVNTASNI